MDSKIPKFEQIRHWRIKEDLYNFFSSDKLYAIKLIHLLKIQQICLNKYEIMLYYN